MHRFLAAVSLLAISATFAPAKVVPGDAKRGSELIRTQGCVNCHRIGGEGGAAAPDLGKARGRNYTPSSLASAMWNHAPAMWSAMEKQGATRPTMNESQAGDLFAYFHSIRYFDKPGDAARGKRVFVSSRCGDCHGRSEAMFGGAPPIAAWKSLSSPIVFAQAMWNHAPQMEEAMAKRKIKWAPMTSESLTDLLVYVQGLPETRGRVREFALSTTGKGEALFAEKGCKTCHQGKLNLDTKLQAGTVTDFAVAMWNHAPTMAAQGRRSGVAQPKLEAAEMQEIVTYLWDKTLFAEPGNAVRGKTVFEKKNCAGCHNDRSSGAPELKQWQSGRGDPVRAFSMMSVLWTHGPQMLQGMKAKNLPWPVFTKQEMMDLIAFLNNAKPGSAD